MQWRWFSKNNGSTPADDIAPQIITDCGNLTLDFKQLGLWAFSTLPPDSGPWFPNEIQNLLSSEKRTLDHWTTVQFFFFLAQVRTPLTTTVAKFLDTSVCGALDALTAASVHSLWRVSMIVFWTTVRSAVFPMMCSLVNQTERSFWRLRKSLQVFWVDSLIVMSPYSNLLRLWIGGFC